MNIKIISLLGILIITNNININIEAKLAQEIAHPRLFFGNEEIKKLQQEVKIEPKKTILNTFKIDTKEKTEKIKKQKNKNNISIIGETAQSNCFLYLLTEDNQYAKIAKKHIEELIKRKDERQNKKTKGLTLYTIGSFLAKSYDFCYTSEIREPEFKKQISKTLLEQAQIIITNGGTLQNKRPGSNRQANRWSSAGLILLATDEKRESELLDKSHKKIIEYLDLNPGKQGSAWNLEGLGYTYYTFGNFLGPYGIAINKYNQEKGKQILNHAGNQNTYRNIYSSLYNGKQLLHPNRSNDTTIVNGQGIFGISFYYGENKYKKGFKYMYDQIQKQHGYRDTTNGGLLRSLLYYPTTITGENPIKIKERKKNFDDRNGNGIFTFRNDYKDENDIIIQYNSKHQISKGHKSNDGFGFRIITDNTNFIEGPKKNISTIATETSIYPNDPETPYKIYNTTGKTINFKQNSNGGYVISETKINNIGTQKQKRRFLIDFNKKDEITNIIIADETQNGKYRHLTTTQNLQIKDKNIFTITNENGTELQGTILYPSKTTIQTGHIENSKMKYINFQSNNGKFIVILTLSKNKNHPTIKLKNNLFSQRSIIIGKKTYNIKNNAFSY